MTISKCTTNRETQWPSSGSPADLSLKKEVVIVGMMSVKEGIQRRLSHIAHSSIISSNEHMNRGMRKLGCTVVVVIAIGCTQRTLEHLGEELDRWGIFSSSWKVPVTNQERIRRAKENVGERTISNWLACSSRSQPCPNARPRPSVEFTSRVPANGRIRLDFLGDTRKLVNDLTSRRMQSLD